MTLKTGNAPHLRQGERSGMLSLDMLIVMMPLCIFSTFYYGLRPVLLVLTGIGTALICETVCCLMMKRKPGLLDGTAAVTGGLVGLLMPASAPYWMPVLAAAFAILVAKMPFGGTGRNLFNPAAAGIAVVTLCFSGLFFLYPDPGLNAPLPLNTAAGVITEASPAAQLAGGGQTIYTWFTLLSGSFPGPLGATAIGVLATCYLYLLTRRTASPLITVPFLLVCAASAILFPRVSGGWMESVMLELCSGYLLFCGVFLLTDPVTAPRHWLGRIVYGALAGVLVMALRYSGRFEEGACFAVLLVNAFSPLIDRFCWKLVNVRRLRREGRGQ